MERSFYDVLGVRRDANDDEIRKAYKKAALKSHPDRHAAAPAANGVDPGEEFKKVNEAYTVLSNPSNRKLYDTYGGWPPPEDFGAPPPNATFARSGTPRRATDEFVFVADPFFAMPGFFDFDMPMPPFPAFPELRVPQPVFSEPPPVFLVSEPLSMFDSVFTQQPGGLAKGMEEPFFFLDPQGGNPFRRQRHYRRSDPSGVHDHASYSSQPPSGQTSRQSSRSSTRHNSDAPHPIWVEEKTIKHTVNGKEQRYTMQKDVEGNVYETIEVPGESKRYIVNHVTILPTSEGVRIPGEQPHDSRRHEKSREKARTRESSRVRDHDHDHKHPDASRRSSDGLRHPSSKYPAAPPPPLPRNPFQQPPTAGPGIPTFYPPAQPYPPAHPIVPPQAPQPPPQSHPMIPNPYEHAIPRTDKKWWKRRAAAAP